MTSEIIEKIKENINQRKMLEVKKLLNDLEEEIKELQKFKDFSIKVKRLIRNQGRSNVVSVQIFEELIVEYDIK